MDESPNTTKSPGQKSSVLILRLHDHAESLKALEVLGQSKRHSRTSSRKGRVDHSELLEFWNIGDARILDTPNLFRILARVCRQCWYAINSPVIDSIR